VLEETYEAVIKSVVNLPHYTDRVPALLQEVEKQNPKAKNAKPEEFVDGRFSASSIKAGLSAPCKKIIHRRPGPAENRLGQAARTSRRSRSRNCGVEFRSACAGRTKQ
jgi:hypothetical protein